MNAVTEQTHHLPFSRRGVLAALLSVLLTASSLGPGNDDAEAKKHGKHRKNTKRRKPKAKTRIDAVCPALEADSGLISTNGNLRLAQTFTALRSGPLARAELHIRENPGVLGDLVLQIGAVDAFGTPTNEVLASTSLANQAIPDGESTVAFAFSKPAVVAAGTQYALILTRPGSDILEWVGQGGDSCAGTEFISDNQTAPFVGVSNALDLIFTTFVKS